VNEYTHNKLIVATALPVINTCPAKQPCFFFRGDTKAVVFSKALSKLRSHTLLQKRTYVTDNNNIDNSNNNSILNDSTLNINDSINIDKIYSRGQATLEEGVPSLEDLLKFKVEIQKIREEEFEKWLPNIDTISSSMHESFPHLYPAPDDIEPGANNVNLFIIIKKIYNKIMNKDIQINDSNIDTLSNLIKKDEDSQNLSEEVKTTLENITANLNDSLSSNGLRPLGNFGDITLNQLFENMQSFNFSMVLNNTELLVYPITFVPFSLVYYKLVKSYMNHCDNIKDIRRIKNERLMLEQLKIRRLSIALAVGFIIPLSSLMILKISKISILDGFNFKIRNDIIEHAKAPTKDQILSLFLLNKGASFEHSSFLKKEVNNQRVAPAKKRSHPSGENRSRVTLPRKGLAPSSHMVISGKHKNNLNRKNNKFKIIIVIILLLVTAAVYFNFFSWLFNTITLNFCAASLTIFFFVLYLISFFYYLFGFFILKIKGNINIDLSFIKIIYIRSLIESIIIIKNSNSKLAIDILQKTINRQLIMYIFLLILFCVFCVFR
jgi:hypothetical protein